MQTPTLTLRRILQAPAVAVFAAFVSSEALREWWAPPGFEVIEARVNAEVGGEYHVVMRALTDAHIVAVRGVYREITPPAKLVFTHTFESRSSDPRFAAAGLIGHHTLVTVELHARGDVTELVLVQEQIPTAEAEQVLQAGWHGILETLARYLTRAGGDHSRRA